MALFSTKKRKAVAGLTVGFTAGILGLALAYWTTTGTGSGSATAGDTTGVVVNQTSTVSGLYPGGPAQPLSGNFNNPNSGKVYISTVTASITPFSSRTDLSKPACTQADFTLAGSPMTVGAEIPSGVGVGAWSGATIAMIDNPTANQDNCKTVSVPITYSVP